MPDPLPQNRRRKRSGRLRIQILYVPPESGGTYFYCTSYGAHALEILMFLSCGKLFAFSIVAMRFIIVMDGIFLVSCGSLYSKGEKAVATA